MKNGKFPILVVGSLGLDDIITPLGKTRNALGGSSSYVALAASFFCPVRLVGVVGGDFPRHHVDLFRRRHIDLGGLEIIPGGKTFHWTGKYRDNFKERDTLDIQLNVFTSFHPKIPANFAATPFVLLANIDPDLQREVLDQVKKPKIVMADTMNLWIKNKKASLLALLKKVDIFILNDEEAQQLTGISNIIKAGSQIQKFGPGTVIIKKGEHGALLFRGKTLFSAPAFPVPEVRDPTGAGDSFAGACLGYLAEAGTVTDDTLRRAILYGTAAAAFTVEAFSVEKLAKVSRRDLDRRFDQLRMLIRVP